ncbi:MAG: polyprenyl synthetase family protein [Bdellovibrionales bacterium]|nr:polyprenyl synthetase family protein [Bdellovibrionales bacterium]
MKNLDLTDLQVHTLNEVYKDLFNGGKGLRARLTRDISKHLDLSENEINLLEESVEGIHHSSILHDDVLDSSPLRRNRLTAWVKFSKNKAILAGDYLLAQVSFKISEYGNLDLLKLTSITIKKMVQGEWSQSENLGKETLKSLDQIHILKTSPLFQWCLKAPFFCCRKNNTDLYTILDRIGCIFGQLFQRSDDMMDFGFRNKENKDVFKDLKEGYLNFFGVFLKESSQITDMKTLRSCRNPEDLKKLIGEEELKKQVEKFDELNTKLILECEMYIDQLSTLLSHQDLGDTLKSWCHKLYFR